MKGLVAFATDVEDYGRLARAVQRLLTMEPGRVIVVAEWPVARELSVIGAEPDWSVEPFANGVPLSLVDVWSEAVIRFSRHRKLAAVIPVCSPLFLTEVKDLMLADGYAPCPVAA